MSGGRQSRWLRGAVALLALLLIACALIPLIPSDRWWIRIFIFPQAQVTALLLLVALAIPFVSSLRRPAGLAMMAALATTIAYQLHYLLAYTPLWSKQIPAVAECTAGNRVRLLVLNVQMGDALNEEMVDLVREVEPDLFLAVETEPEWLRRLPPLGDAFSHVVTAARDGAWGMALFSRLPLVDAEVRYVVDAYVPSIKTAVRLPSGERITFYGLHTKPPILHSTRRADAELIRTAREIARSDSPALLAGDLNDVPWSNTIARFQEISGMRAPRVGRTFAATFWPLPPLVGWPLDYAFASDSFALQRFEVMPDVGTDHLPVLADFCLT